MDNRPPRHGWQIPRVPRLHMELIAGACDDYGADWGGGGRWTIRDDFSRLYTLASGRARISFENGAELDLRPGWLGLIPAGRTACYRCAEPMRLAWVHFRLEVLPMVDLFALWNPPVRTACEPAERQMLEQLIVALGTHTPRAALFRHARLLDLLGPFLPASWDDLLPPQEARQRLQPALAALVADPAHPWTLGMLAGRVHLHPTYFSNLFRRTFGMPPLRYLAQLRIRRACDLLRAGDLRIGEVAGQCGFPDPLQFSRFFRRSLGVSPREFRAAGGKTLP